jgi:tRNA pseudouridine55 synthase
VDGILNINKPGGKTSFSIVAMVRRLIRERRVGHAGTLDITASGVLPVCFGKGTRVIEFLMDAHKVYRAWVKLGIATDTYDATGKIVQQEDASNISQEQLESALNSFRGLIRQTPPMYSAIKNQGRRLYELARAGITVNRKSRLAKVYRLELLDFKPPLVTLEIECGQGTYIRSLAHDLGQLLGCGAYLENLVRLKYGPFDIADAVTLPQLEDAFNHDSWRQLVYPIDIGLLHWAAVVVDDVRERLIRNGGSVVIENGLDRAGLDRRCRAYSQDGCFIAVLNFNPESRQWQPEKVFL